MKKEILTDNGEYLDTVNVYICKEMNEKEELLSSYALVNVYDEDETVVVNNEIKSIFDKDISDKIRRLYIIDLVYNHKSIIAKYFAWVNKYIDSSRMNEADFASAMIIKNFYEDGNPEYTKISIPNDLELSRGISAVSDIIIAAHRYSHDEDFINAKIEELKQYTEIINVFYYNINDLFEMDVLEILNEEDNVKKR